MDFLGDLDIEFNDKLFDMDEDDGFKINENRYIKPKPHINPRFVHYKYAKEMASEIYGHVFHERGRIFAYLAGSFIFGDLIEALLVEANLKAKEITISTLSLSQENIDSLKNLQDGDYVDSINLIVSDYFFSHNHKNIRYIYDSLDNGKFQLAVAGSHTKIVLIKMEDGQKIVIHGSANLRSSASLEAICIETDDELYDFNMTVHAAILKKHKTINKSIRVNALDKLIERSIRDGERKS